MANEQATVFNPTTKERKAVTVGDPNAFVGGFQLETPTNNLQTINAGSLTSNGNIKIEPAPKPELPAITTTVQPTIADQMKDYIGAIPKPVDPTEAYNQSLVNAGIDEKTADVNAKAQITKSATDELNNVNAQLAAVNAQIDKLNNENTARNLAIENQGAQVTTGGVSLMENQNIRENAIKILPYASQATALSAQALVAQAKISSAQGDEQLAQATLTQAQQKVDTLFKMKTDYATALNAYNTDLVKTAYSFADKAQQAALDAASKKQDQDFAVAQQNRATSADLAKQAIASGQGALISSINAIDPTDPNYNSKIATVQSQLKLSLVDQAQIAASKASTAASYASMAGNDSQKVLSIADAEKLGVPYGTTQAEAIAMGKTPGDAGNKGGSLDQLSFLKDTAAKALSLSDAAGPSGIKRFLGDTFVGDTKFRQLEQVTNTLKTNVLSLMTDPNIKKFFGPQMSEADVRMMTSAGTTLDAQANSPEQLRAEISRLDSLFTRMQKALDVVTVVSPTGQVGTIPVSQLQDALKQGYKQQ